jgi:hypothetical protein
MTACHSTVLDCTAVFKGHVIVKQNNQFASALALFSSGLGSIPVVTTQIRNIKKSQYENNYLKMEVKILPKYCECQGVNSMQRNIQIVNKVLAQMFRGHFK